MQLSYYSREAGYDDVTGKVDDVLETSSVERLKEQISHPSVVSLDPAASEGGDNTQVSSAEGNGPGMNI